MLRSLEAAGLELDQRDSQAFQDFLEADVKPVEAGLNRIGRAE
ncbi:MAG: hypothetical protein ACK5PU_05560 [bacterium]|jgi:hypothetical protein